MKEKRREVKVKVRFTYIAPQAAYAASALCVTDMADIQPRPQPKPELADFALDTAACSPSLPC